MRFTIFFVLSCLAVFASGFYVTKDVKYADKDFLVKQQFIFEVLQHIHQDHLFDYKYAEYKNYHLQEHYDNYHKPELIKEYVEFYEHEPFEHDEIFSVFNRHHVKHAAGLVATFYYAKDFEAFKSSVLWARYHVNRQLFLYGLHVACVHRPDMQGIVFPAIYELYPYYFFGGDVIQKAHHYKMQGFYGVKKVEDVYSVVIPSNYTGPYDHMYDDKLLSYFLEDIGWNSFYYYYNIDYPYWTEGDEHYLLKKDRRGALYFFIHWQLLARYYLERLSNGLGEIEDFSWRDYHDHHHEYYYSKLHYYNGLSFPYTHHEQQSHYHLNYLIDHVDTYYNRIYNAIDSMKYHQYDGHDYLFKDHSVEDVLNHLGAIVQGSQDSLNRQYYGSFERYLRYILNNGVSYGHHLHHTEKIPGVLMHYETSLRDPVFYQAFKRILEFYWHYMDTIPSYTYNELAFDGVKIENVEMDKLVTYFDKFDSDITNAVNVEPYDDAHATAFGKFGRLSQHKGHDFVVKTRQHRLNHLPFNVKLTVNSNQPQKAVVKVFIGPKYDRFGHKVYLTENRQDFYELDHFVVDLNAGKNVITRNSNDFSWFVSDRTTYYELYKKVMQAYSSPDYKFPLDQSEAHCGFPNRLMLPRGKRGGMPFQFFYFVYPYHEPKVKQFTGYDPVVSCGIGSGSRFIDDTSFGYPLDRKIDVKHWYHHDNMYYYDTLIYFKTESEVNAVH